MTDRQQTIYAGLIRLHSLARGPGHLFSTDRIAEVTGIHRRSTHNDLQVLIGLERVRVVRGDGKRFYGARDYR
jgi:hypothetical protein